jgi:hypothetical protein
MPTTYKIIGREPYVYLDAFKHVVDGFRVFFTVDQTGETFFVQVPSLAAGGIKTAIDAMVKQLDDISKI